MTMTDGYDDESLRAELKRQIGTGTAIVWARKHGLCDEQLYLFLRGSRPAEPKLLKAMGLKRVVRYYPAEEDSNGLAG